MEPKASSPADSLYDRIGGEPAVRALAARFYEVMAKDEPALARLHLCDADGRVDAQVQDRFALFLVGWLGGPQDYHRIHGHPRLRMRHAHVPVNLAMRDAWVRCMHRALEGVALDPLGMDFLRQRFAEVADFLRNQEG